MAKLHDWKPDCSVVYANGDAGNEGTSGALNRNFALFWILLKTNFYLMLPSGRYGQANKLTKISQ